MIDLTVNLGHIITIGSFLAGGFGFIYHMRGHIDMLADRMRGAEQKLDKLVDVAVLQARHDERFTAMEGRMAAFERSQSECWSRVNRLADDRGT
jgi:hypothetical protein